MLGLPAPGENPMRNEYSGALGDWGRSPGIGELTVEDPLLENPPGPLRSYSSNVIWVRSRDNGVGKSKKQLG